MPTAANPCRSPLLSLSFCLIALLSYRCAAWADSSGNKPAQFNNGLGGTPNLPVAPCRFIDLTHMRGASNGFAYALESALKQDQTFDEQVATAIQNYLDALKALKAARVSGDKSKIKQAESNLAEAKTLLTNLVETEYAAVEDDVHTNDVPSSSFYVGSEVRAGSGETEYVLPVLAYCDSRSGIELGSESFFEFGDANSDGHDGLGVSLKGEFTDIARAFPRKVSRLRAALAKISATKTDVGLNFNDVTALHRFLTDKYELTDQQLLTIANGYRDIALSDTAPVDPSLSERAAATELKALQEKLKAIKALEQQTQDLLVDYVRLTKRPMVAGFVGNRLYNQGGGSLLDGGLSASQLFPFRSDSGSAGVTALVVAQGFDDRLQGDQRRGAKRLGLAAIWQDRTPSYDAAKRRLGAPWNVKVGLEYTSPLLGLKSGYAGFVQYRTLPSYVEITLAVGKDGQRKDYVDLSIGKSIAF